MKSIKVGVEILPTGSIEKIIELGRKCEEGKIDSIWITDHYYNKNVYIVLTLLALNTKNILLGIGVTNPYVVHPAWTASAVLTLREVAGDRIVLGIGVGDKTTLESIGVERKKPIKAVRECIEIIRRLLQGENVILDGEVFKIKNAKLNIKEKVRVPIYIGTQAPRLLQLAGELADGVLINASNSEIVRECIREVELGLEKSNRNIDSIDIGVCTCFSVDEDHNSAINSAKIVVAYIMSGLSGEALKKLKIDEEKVERVREELLRGNCQDLMKIITEEDVEKLAIAGTPEECIEKIEKMKKTGIKHIILGSPLGKDKKKAIELISREIIPIIKENT